MSYPTPFPAIIGLVVLTGLLVVLGLLLRRNGRLVSRRGWLIWAVVSLLPLFGSGILLFIKHQTELSTGETRVRDDPAVQGQP